MSASCDCYLTPARKTPATSPCPTGGTTIDDNTVKGYAHCWWWSSIHQFCEQIPELLLFLSAQAPERLGKYAAEDDLRLNTHLFASESQPMTHGTTRAGSTFDESALDHPCRQRSERLVCLEGELRQVVQRRIRVLMQVPQRVPLHKGDAERRESLVGCAVVPHLESLDRESHTTEFVRHDSSVSTLSQLVYINMLI